MEGQTEIDFAIEAAGTKVGPIVRFLLEHMDDRDRAEMSIWFLLENASLAAASRDMYPWAKALPEQLFLEYVCPYAVFDEERDSWRPILRDLCGTILATNEATVSVSAVVQIINERLWELTGVRYSTERRAPNQCVTESMRLGKASCTGLSILLVNALRSVGIAARAVGTPLWSKGSGNHTWIEFFDPDTQQWHFTGSAEQDPAGHDRGWFVQEASRAVAGSQHAIYATSFARRPTVFPMVWAPLQPIHTVYADDVTSRYAKKHDDRRPLLAPPPSGNENTSTSVDAFREDLARVHGDLQKLAPSPKWSDVPLTEVDAAQVRKILWDEHVSSLHREYGEQYLVREEIRVEGHAMRFSARVFGEAPVEGRPLVLSLHGGGGAPAQVNDQQWQNQGRMYHAVMPPGALYVCPRAPTNNWNLWHENHMDALLMKLIDCCIVFGHVNPDRVYLIGYSAGGDGVYKIAPRMAFCFAGASACAGHPNGEPLASLRNLPFSISCGLGDNAYNRNSVGQEYAAELKRLAQLDGQGGYVHWSLFPQTGHWMNNAEQETLTWISKQKRVNRPFKVVWRQNSDRLHRRFYWLESAGEPNPKTEIVVERQGNTFEIVSSQGVSSITILLDDLMCDLKQPIRVLCRGVILFEGMVHRSIGAILACLQHRGDPSMIFDAKITVEWN